MSFKRGSDDISYLNSLRQRRIRDLITEDIPEDEASLLSNGRFACTVCFHNPVFDTVDMLAVHRKGKKHQASMYQHEQKKSELKELIKKRRHEEFIKTGSSDIKIGEANIKLLHKATPYDARVKKKLKPYDRKPKLNLDLSVETTSTGVLPGNRTQDIVQMQDEGKYVHPRQLKKIFEKPDSNFQVQPYQSKSSKIAHSDTQSTSTSTSTNIRIHMPPVRNSCAWPSLQESQGGLVFPENRIISPTSQTMISTGATSPSSVSPEAVPGSTRNKSNNSKTLPPGKKEIALKYWQMAGSGWKKDWDGKWIRDEECEFDSDEEPPDLP